MYKYEIYFKNGNKISFDSNSSQKEIFSEFTRVGFQNGMITMNDLLINVSNVSYVIEVKQ